MPVQHLPSRHPLLTGVRAHIQHISDGSGGSADHAAQAWNHLLLLGDELGTTVFVLPSGCL